MDLDLIRDLDRAAEAIREADAMLIGAGAGMGVDSGLPDFRGNQGFWNAYPLYGELGFSFAQLANPRRFREDPRFAWGFYGHRLNLYRETEPHAGFQKLKRWGESLPFGVYVYTSNVDGHFQRAGFDPARVVECHGAINRLQCLSNCGIDIFPADSQPVDVDPKTFRAAPPLPSCPNCGGMARPNILMFGDSEWDDTVAQEQNDAFYQWLSSLKLCRVVIIECGAGTNIPTVRGICEAVSNASRGQLIRINVREPDVDSRQIGIPLRALEALDAIGERLNY